MTGNTEPKQKSDCNIDYWYSTRFHVLCLRKQQSQTDAENRFSIKWHLTVIQDQTFQEGTSRRRIIIGPILASTQKGPKIRRPKLLKIAGSYHPTII